MNLDECLIPNCECKAKSRSHTFSKGMLEKIYKTNTLYGHFPTINSIYNPFTHEVRTIKTEKCSRCVGLCTKIAENRDSTSELKRILTESKISIEKDCMYSEYNESFCDDILYSLFERRKMIEKDWLKSQEKINSSTKNFNSQLNILHKYNEIILTVFYLRAYIYLYRYFESLLGAKKGTILSHNKKGFSESEIPILFELTKKKMNLKLDSIYKNIESVLGLKSIESYLGYSKNKKTDYLLSDLDILHSELLKDSGCFYFSLSLFREEENQNKQLEEIKVNYPESLGILINRGSNGIIEDYILTGLISMPAESDKGKQYFSQYSIMDYTNSKQSMNDTLIKFHYLNEVFQLLINTNQELIKKNSTNFTKKRKKSGNKVSKKKRIKHLKKNSLLINFNTVDLYAIGINSILVKNSLFFLFLDEESFLKNKNELLNILDYSISLDELISYVESLIASCQVENIPSFSEFLRTRYFNVSPIYDIRRKGI